MIYPQDRTNRTELGMIFGVGDELVVAVNNSTSFGDATWPATSKCFYVAIQCPTIVTIDRIRFVNGSTVSGNVDVGLYDSNGIKLVTSGSTPLATTNAIQTVSVAATVLQPGLNFIGMSVDNTTHHYQRMIVASIIDFILYGSGEQLATFPLPTTSFTKVPLSATSIPILYAVNKLMP